MVDWGRFKGCFARLDRAREHYEEFGAEWARYIERRPAEITHEVDEDGRGRVIVVRHEAPPLRLSLLIGEFMYELRAALDNCLYEIAVHYSGQDPPPGESVLQFPIYETPDGWAANVKRLRHLSNEHRTLLERIQPYQAQRRDLNCLRILNRLARTDRHRTLHVVSSVIAEGRLLVQAPPGSRVVDQRKADNVLAGMGVTEVASFRIDPWSPGQQIEVYPHIELEVEIAEMAAERPWGTLSSRLIALHRAVQEYIVGLAAYQLDLTEPDEPESEHAEATTATARPLLPEW